MPTDGQQDFTGGMVDRVSPDAIPQNAYAYGKNLEIRDGSPRTRRGTRVLQVLQASEFKHALTFQQVQDDGSNDIIFVLADGTLYRYRIPEDCTITCDPTLTADGVRLLQAFNALYVLRGNWLTPVKWSGVDADAFAVMTEPASGDLFPPCSYAIFAYNRIWAVTGVFTINPSDILSDAFDLVGQSYDVTSSFDGSKITAMVPYSEGGIVVFKKNSTWLLNGCNGDLSGLSLTPLDTQHGCVGPDCAIQVGNDVWYLSDDGIRSIQLTMQSKAQMVSVPASNNIRNLVKRINPEHAEKACAAVWDNYVLFSVPMDGADYNTSTIVYDTTLNAWVGEWTQDKDSNGFVQWDAQYMVYWPSMHKLIGIGRKRKNSMITPYNRAIVDLFCDWNQDLHGNQNAVFADIDGNATAVFQNNIDFNVGNFYGICFDLLFIKDLNFLTNTITFSAVDTAFNTYNLIVEITRNYIDVRFSGVTSYWRARYTLPLPSPSYADSGVTSNIMICHDGSQVRIYKNGIECSLSFSITTDKTKWFASSGLVNLTSITNVDFHYSNVYGNPLSNIKFIAQVLVPYVPNSFYVYPSMATIPLNNSDQKAYFAQYSVLSQAQGVMVASVNLGSRLINSYTPLEIPFELKTRAYNTGTYQVVKSFASGEVTLQHRDMTATAYALFRNGMEQLALFANKQYSSLSTDFHKGTVWDQATLATFNAEGRSNIAPVLLPANGMPMNGVGAKVETEVEHTEAFFVGKTEVDMQLQIINTTGTIAVKSLALHAVAQGSTLRRNR